MIKTDSQTDAQSQRFIEDAHTQPDCLMSPAPI